MMESNDPFFSAINAAASTAAAANHFPWRRRPQFSGSADLDAPRSRSARRKRKSSHGVRRRRSPVKEEDDNNDNDDEDDDDDDEDENSLSLLCPNKLTDQDSNPKRCRADQSERTAAINPETGEIGANGDSNEKESSSRQDYIHVRARRGQATDSHSLAERVRREKISERMKLLQNLVPGCNKVMGKALMLDEIINYVQSLQRQVELLSMKLAAVNPLDFCVNSHLRPKDMNNRARQQAPDLQATTQIYRSENSSAGSSYSRRINGTPLESFENKFVLDELDPSFCSSMSMEFPTLDGFADASQLGNFWEDDLQSVVQMGFFGQSRDAQANLLAEPLRPCDDRQQED